jgi:acyl dehydratase
VVRFWPKLAGLISILNYIVLSVLNSSFYLPGVKYFVKRQFQRFMNSSHSTSPGTDLSHSKNSSVPPLERYFEDYREGEIFEFGDRLITAEEIVQFATLYDPQPFHLDDEAAKKTHFGRLAASGWMTASVVMRMMVDHYISRVSSLGSPGIDELRWSRPVHAGDRLRAKVTVLETRASKSKPDRGLMYALNEAFNQNNELVMSFKGWGFYKIRGQD